MYPGSFNPPTVAHLAIAEAALQQYGLDHIDFAVSLVALAKEDLVRPRLIDRMAVLEAVAAARPWLGAITTSDQLLADIAEGYDLLIVGADKWAQIHEDRWYDDDDAKAAALARLPAVTVAPRPPHPQPGELALQLSENVADVSSSKVRDGRREWMTSEAEDFDQRTGAWSDLDRYERWIIQQSAAES